MNSVDDERQREYSTRRNGVLLKICWPNPAASHALEWQVPETASGGKAALESRRENDEAFIFCPSGAGGVGTLRESVWLERPRSEVHAFSTLARAC